MNRLIVFAVLLALWGLVVYFGPPSASPARQERTAQLPVSSSLASSGTTFASSQRVLARTPDGTLHLTYLKPVASHDHVYVARSTDHGRTWSEGTQVSTGSTNATDRHLMVDNQGRLRLFWTQYAVPESGGGEPVRQIFWSAFGGSRWSTPEQLTRRDYNGVPSASIDSRGRIHLVWYGFDGEYYQIEYSRFDDGQWSQPQTISDGFPDSVNPAIAVDSRDNLHVAWYKFTHASKTYQVFYREYDASSGEWLGQKMLSDDLFTATNVSLAITPDDRVVVVYEGLPRPNESALYARVYEHDRWGSQAEIVSPEVDAGRPSVAVDERGRAYAFYHQGIDEQIYLVHSMPDGGWSERRAISKSGRNDYPSVRWSAIQGPVVDGLDVAWTEINANPEDSDASHLIRFRRIPLP